MSHRSLQINVIDCDGPDCDETFAEVLELLPASLDWLAAEHGWQRQADGTHLCPACMEKAESAAAVLS